MTVDGRPADPAESVSCLEALCWFTGCDHAGVLEGDGATVQRALIRRESPS
jgi:hypothetical protein